MKAALIALLASAVSAQTAYHRLGHDIALAEAAQSELHANLASLTALVEADAGDAGPPKPKLPSKWSAVAIIKTGLNGGSSDIGEGGPPSRLASDIERDSENLVQMKNTDQFWNAEKEKDARLKSYYPNTEGGKKGRQWSDLHEI